MEIAERDRSKHSAFAGVAAALVAGVFSVIASNALAALIFKGPLSALAPQGTVIALVTSVLVGGYVALTSSIRCVIAIPQDRVAPILAIMVSGIAVSMQGHDPQIIASTALASLPATALFTGAVLYLLGKFRLGNLVRYIPYPVIGGFLAGSGWLLVHGALELTSGLDLSIRGVEHLFHPDLLGRWLPAALFGTGMFAILRRWNHLLLAPLLLLLAIGGFYGLILGLGLNVDAARAYGWLDSPGPITAGWSGILNNFTSLGEADWGVLLSRPDLLGTIVLTSVVSILLTSSALELAVEEESDLNRELRCAGIGNLLSGSAGGMVGFHSLSLSQLVMRLGGGGRYIGLVVAGVSAAALLGGSTLVGFIPVYVRGGLIFFLGLNFLWDWLVGGWSRLNRLDYLVVLTILGVVAFVSFPAGALTGIVLATLLFIHNYSRVDVVMKALPWGDVTSNVERPPGELRVLTEQREQIHALLLRGYIFFGTANHLLQDVKERLSRADLPPLRAFIVDFKRVTGVDSSALLGLTKVRILARRRGFELILSQMDASISSQMRRSGFLSDDEDAIRVFPDLDHALEYCEMAVLKENPPPQGNEPVSGLASQFTAHGGLSLDADALEKYLKRQEVPAGACFIRQGNKADALYFVESGRVRVCLELGEGRLLRLRSMGPGTVVGESGLYLESVRMASVFAEGDCVLYGLDMKGLEEMQRAQPDLAAAFHRYMVCLLAERQVASAKLLSAMEEG